MLDIKFLRQNPDVVKENIKKKFQDEKLPLVDEVIELDKRNREIKGEVEALRAEKNKVSKEIGACMAHGEKEKAEELKKKVQENAARMEELSAEEILVSIGWLTREQLNECTALAKERNVPLDMILTEKEYLPFDRIASYLKKKYGCDVVSKAQIKVDKSMLKMLPDDIVEKKQIVVMSMEGSKLGVAMVNPNDKFTIREVSLSTGRALNVYCIPYAE